MPEEKLTRRQLYTVHMLQETYIDLLKKKPAHEISIVELCEQADINRTTFYRYYKDLDDLGEKMTEELFQQIFSILNAAPQPGVSAQKQILQALNATLKNRKLCRHLLSDSHSDLAEKSLEENLTLIKATVLSTGCTPEEGKLCYNYLCGGLARLWVSWINSNFKTPKEKVALMIEEIIVRYYEMLEGGFLLREPK